MDTPRLRSQLLTAARGLAFILAAVSLSTASSAVTEGRTAAGHRYMAGGIGSDEADTMRAHAAAFPLQVVIAAKSGAYLANVHVRITGPGNEALLDQPIDAPWLLVDLPPGRYTLRATYGGESVEQRTTIAAGRSERVVLHFDVATDDERAPAASDGSGAPGLPPAR